MTSLCEASAHCIKFHGELSAMAFSSVPALTVE